MKWQIAAVGKPSLRYAKSGVEEYLDRLRRYVGVTLDCGSKDAGSEENGRRQLARTEGALRLVCDERGQHWTTAEFAERVNRWQLDGVKRVAVLVGGSDGHSEDLREAADHVIALSPFTLQHELALVVLLEQIYRVHTLLRGEPYHR